MKVSDKHLSAESLDGSSKAGAAKSKSTPNKKAVDTTGENLGSAKVQLSGRAQDIKKIRAAVDSAPDVDEAKVAKLKSLIASGQYKTDAKAIADKMVDEYAYGDILDKE